MFKSLASITLLFFTLSASAMSASFECSKLFVDEAEVQDGLKNHTEESKNVVMVDDVQGIMFLSGDAFEFTQTFSWVDNKRQLAGDVNSLTATQKDNEFIISIIGPGQKVKGRMTFLNCQPIKG